MSDNRPLRVLHFADAHIDHANRGRHDPATGLPVRVLDFLSSLDQIVEAAIAEAVDLVIFAGDAYKDRNPQPTFQREWGSRIMRLSQAGIPTLLLVGNHDLSPALGRASTLQEFKTLAVPHVHVADKIRRWEAAELGAPVQVVTVPWVSRNQLMTREEMSGLSLDAVWEAIGERVTKSVTDAVATADPNLPLILAAHAGVEGAALGSERLVKLGQDFNLSVDLVKDRRFDYVALGHIHKHQVLNERPPVVYPGSIERIDFGEARETKGYVLAEIRKGGATWRFVPLKTRPYVDLDLEIPSAETFMDFVMSKLPPPGHIEGAVCRVQLTYPQDWEPMLDERRIYDHFRDAFSFHIRKHRLTANRSRLGDTAAVESLTPLGLLDLYWRSIDLPEQEQAAMQQLAREVIGRVVEVEGAAAPGGGGDG